MIRIWILVILAFAVALMCGVRNCDIGLVLAIVVGEMFLPAPEQGEMECQELTRKR